MNFRDDWMPQLVRNIKTVLLLAVIYFFVDASLNRFFSDGWTIIWPLNGVNIAVLLLRPRRDWVWILLGIELGTGAGEMLEDDQLGMEICLRLFSVTEVVISALLLPPFSNLDQWFRTPRIFARFVAALLLGPGISGVLAAVLFHFVQGQPFALAFNNWATCDAVGIAATLPLALSLNSAQMRTLFERRTLPRTLGLLTFTFVGAALIFSVGRYPLVFLLYPLLLLVDSILAFAGTAIAVFGVCMISIYCTSHSLGPFGRWPADLAIPRDLALQLYFGFHTIALFPASIMSMERRRLAEDLMITNGRLTVLASLDGLTGIPNRRLFDERFAQEWMRAVRLRKPIALALIDLDFFKQFNDLYGHVAGDRCLCAVGRALSANVQRIEDLVARYGGEEFVLLLPQTSADAAFKVLEEIRDSILDLKLDHLGNPWNRVTVSIGYSSCTPSQGDESAGLIKLADAALYLAKSAGRNRVETLSSIDGLKTTNDHSATAKNRVLRIVASNDRV